MFNINKIFEAWLSIAVIAVVAIAFVAEYTWLLSWIFSE